MQNVFPQARSPLERMIRRDRLASALALAAICVLAWTYLVRMAASMQATAMETQMHVAMGMADMRVWGASDWLALFVMWAVMMVGMMLPSAAPLILLVLGVYRRRDQRYARVSAWAFVAGYLLAWTSFSAAAAGLQVVLHRTALLTGDMTSSSTKLAGVILLMAGLYQWLPIKKTCLTHCQSPLGFLTRHWQDGVTGGLKMGLRHGVFCVGCCWALMTLLFVVGVMNLLWVAAIAAFVLFEKLARQAARFGRLAGALLVGWGIGALVWGSW